MSDLYLFKISGGKMTILSLNLKRFLALIFTCLFIISCSDSDESHSSDKATWTLLDAEEFPKDRPLSRVEDGVMLLDGSLIVADQRYGLAHVDVSGEVTPFGNFQVLGYQHNPPNVEAGPNGINLTPDKRYVLTADVLSGQIYKTSIESNSSEIIYSHEYGVNTARQDSTGAIWFTQSTENKNEARLFGALAQVIPDGALYRLPAAEEGSPQIPELILEGLNFANGFYIDEASKKFYLSEMMSSRVLAFDLDISSGSLSNQTTLAQMPSPDNMALNHDGTLWVASPLANQIFSIDVSSGTTKIVFDAQTEEGFKLVDEGLASVKNGDGWADLVGPELTGNMPGLLTGMILGDEDQPFYVANLGAALIKVSP